MTEYEPNERQQELIDATNGIHVVDAGAGTGKTFTITLAATRTSSNRATWNPRTSS